MSLSRREYRDVVFSVQLDASSPPLQPTPLAARVAAQRCAAAFAPRALVRREPHAAAVRRAWQRCVRQQRATFLYVSGRPGSGAPRARPPAPRPKPAILPAAAPKSRFFFFPFFFPWLVCRQKR